MRVDIRGTGDSDGILRDEYLRAEQDDALEVLSWLERQPWCDGNVGLIGYSWGGFNGLQIAARRPPQLKAVVSMYSTDDRYTDDCHYMGGCLLASDMLKWATWMRAFNALPPDPRFRDDWRETWLYRLDQTPAFIEPWMSHPLRDAYWRQGSIAEDYGAIEAATLVVGGWTDAYTNAVPRLLERLECPRRGIIGPWGHTVPYLGVPGPAIGFLHECLRWFDRWLKGVDTGVERDPLVRYWMSDSFEPAGYHAELPGRWAQIGEWPTPTQSRQLELTSAGELVALPGGESAARVAADAETVRIESRQASGQTAGVWCANGRADETPLDQRPDDELSACFDTAPLGSPLEVLGTPVARLRLGSDEPAALVAVRLCEVAPDGVSNLVSWGLWNLTHRAGHEAAEPLEPGRSRDVEVPLNVIGHRFSAGNRLRLAISPTYWPHAWPSPRQATLSLELGGASWLELPELELGAEPLERGFEPPERVALPADARSSRKRTRTTTDGRHAIEDRESRRELVADSATLVTSESSDVYRIAENDPLSARVECARTVGLERDGWQVRVECEATMTADATDFRVQDRLRAWAGDELVFERERRFDFPREGL